MLFNRIINRFLAVQKKICNSSEFYIIFDDSGSAKSIFHDPEINNYTN